MKKGALGFLYETASGRILLKVLASRSLSKFFGALLSSPVSKPLNKGFVKNNDIKLEDFNYQEWRCFNDCFARKIKPELRPFPKDPEILPSPCDGLVSAYKIEKSSVFPIKQSEYTIPSLLENEELAKKYEDGICLVIRLCVHNYHRYSYLDNGCKGENIFLEGKLHTVRPIALENRPVFIENCREYTILSTENFGEVAQIEVGAMLVGKIQNHHSSHTFKRGEEKGTFLYGGSTIVLLFEKDKVEIKEEFFQNTAQGIETPIKMGEALGKSLNAIKL